MTQNININNNIDSNLDEKELLFCEYYIETGNTKEAAISAGYKNNPERVGTRLLYDEKIFNEIKKLYEKKRKNLVYRTVSGYERLAFGSISDCIKLLFCEDLNFSELKNMNLFNISEIKKPKDGSMEIKFFDRIRALEKLEQVENIKSSDKECFYSVLENSIKNLNNNSGD